MKCLGTEKGGCCARLGFLRLQPDLREKVFYRPMLGALVLELLLQKEATWAVNIRIAAVDTFPVQVAHRVRSSTEKAFCCQNLAIKAMWAFLQVENSDLHWRVDIIDSSMKDPLLPQTVQTQSSSARPSVSGLPTRTHVAGRASSTSLACPLSADC